MERECLPLERPLPSLTDSFGRVISYLRLSVTDRCNLRCYYCMCKDVKFLPKAEVLSLEEMERLCSAFVRLGVRKLRLTGGEPLVRPGVVGLLTRLGHHLKTGALDELTLTTNGTLLEKYAADLAAAGVSRVNVSLDTLDPITFRQITGHGGLEQVLAGIDAARNVGIGVRINTVALGGINDRDFDRLLAWSGEHDCDMALIEMMPMGGSAASSQPPLLLDEVRRRLDQNWTLEPVSSNSSGPAVYARVAETGRRIGFITPMSHGFCQSCNRVRLTCIGTLMLCLGQDSGIDLRGVLRQADTDQAIDAAILAAIAQKPQTHHFALASAAPDSIPHMWQMGG